MWNGFFWLRLRFSGGVCQHKPASIYGGEFFVNPSVHQFLKKEFDPWNCYLNH